MCEFGSSKGYIFMRIFKNKRRTIIFIIKYVSVFLLVLVLGILYSCQRNDKDKGVNLELEAGNEADSIKQDNSKGSNSSNGSSNSGNSSGSGDSSNSSDSNKSDDFQKESIKYICVHITGYVANPGVYDVMEGARIYEVVRLAGGFLPEADESYLNLASVVCDGQKIQVLSKEEAKTAKPFVSPTDSETTPKLININTASKEQLMQLPGIGESRALSIISYREEHGGFDDITDIMNISGIKEAAFNKIKDYICTE